jgi:DNA-binding MarR family transcriptional regulator
MAQTVETTSSFKRAMHGAFRFLETFRELRSDMPMQTASVFLLVAMKPGIGQRELLDLMGLSQPAISRNVYALTAIDRHGKPGLNLIVQHRNPADARNTMLYLTAEGNALLNRLLSISRPQG